MPCLLTFGDSNTYGTPAMTDRAVMRRHPPADRWPPVAAARLGTGWTLVEEGLPGRTTVRDDPVMGAHMNGATGLRIALQSHGPIDVLTIMLGTNDTKTRFGATPGSIAAGIATLLDIAQGPEMQGRHGGFAILLIAPPPVRPAGVLAADFFGAATVWQETVPQMQRLAQARGVAFLDAGQHVLPDPVDGVHLDAAAHRVLGAAVADRLAAGL